MLLFKFTSDSLDRLVGIVHPELAGYFLVSPDRSEIFQILAPLDLSRAPSGSLHRFAHLPLLADIIAPHIYLVQFTVPGCPEPRTTLVGARHTGLDNRNA